VDAPRGVELLGVIVAPSGPVWRARVVTYPHTLWTMPGSRALIKFVGTTPGEAEARALDFVLKWCAERHRAPRDGFGPWDHHDGQDTRRPPPRKRRSIAVRYGTAGAMTLTSTLNLSSGGMFLLATLPPEAGTVLDLELEVYGCVACLKGIVVWVRRELGAGRPRGMGVRLLDPPPVYRLLVRGLL
jgi:hypothetical protein